MNKLIDYSLRGEPRIFRQHLPADAPRVIVDAGAGDGTTWSLSREFVDEGWRALLIEENPALFRQLRSNCKDHANVTCIQSSPGSQAVKSQERESLLGALFGKIRNLVTTPTAEPQPLSAVLAEHQVPRRSESSSSTAPKIHSTFFRERTWPSSGPGLSSRRTSRLPRKIAAASIACFQMQGISIPESQANTPFGV